MTRASNVARLAVEAVTLFAILLALASCSDSKVGGPRVLADVPCASTSGATGLCGSSMYYGSELVAVTCLPARQDLISDKVLGAGQVFHVATEARALSGISDRLLIALRMDVFPQPYCTQARPAGAAPLSAWVLVITGDGSNEAARKAMCQATLDGYRSAEMCA